MATNVIRRKELYTIIPEGLLATSKWWLVENNFAHHAIDKNIKKCQLKNTKKLMINYKMYYINDPKISITNLLTN